MDPRVSFPRWVAKKAARIGLASVNVVKGSDGSRDAPGIRALTYHRFGESPRDPFCVRAQDFEAQMRWLAERSLAISLEDVEELLVEERDIPAGVLVTIDDGCRSTLAEALPVLRAYGIPAVAYVVVGSIGRGRGIDAEQPEDYMTWDEIDALLESGVVAIGSHAMHHRSMARLPQEQLRDELAVSRELLERYLGIEVRSFAYPFGTRGDYSDETRRALAEAGYTTAFTAQHGPITADLDPLELPRIKVEGGEPLWAFRSLCRGGLDPWRHVDRTLASLQT